MTIESLGLNFDPTAVVSDEITVSASTSNNLNRADFLTLFVAQLKNQDPLNPLDSTAFTAQLAQFSSLEQLLNVNENLESLKTSQEQDSRFRVLDFLGKEVIADGDMLFLEQDKMSGGAFTLTEKAASSVQIVDSTGVVIRQIPLGILDAGQHRFTWDGLDESGNKMGQGIYGFEVTAVAEDGFILPVTTRITGKVTGVNLETESPVLFVGDIPVYPSQVREIQAFESAVL